MTVEFQSISEDMKHWQSLRFVTVQCIPPTYLWTQGDGDSGDTAPCELAPADPNVTPAEPVETEQERIDRLWRAVVDASQG